MERGGARHTPYGLSDQCYVGSLRLAVCLEFAPEFTRFDDNIRIVISAYKKTYVREKLRNRLEAPANRQQSRGYADRIVRTVRVYDSLCFREIKDIKEHVKTRVRCIIL